VAHSRCVSYKGNLSIPNPLFHCGCCLEGTFTIYRVFKSQPCSPGVRGTSDGAIRSLIGCRIVRLAQCYLTLVLNDSLSTCFLVYASTGDTRENTVFPSRATGLGSTSICWVETTIRFTRGGCTCTLHSNSGNHHAQVGTGAHPPPRCRISRLETAGSKHRLAQRSSSAHFFERYR
jgi:hypothetical protein